MKKMLLLIIVALAIYLMAQTNFAPRTARYYSEFSPLSFEYRTGESGYYLAEELGSAETTPEDFIEALILISYEDHQSLLRGERAGGEGPPTLNLQVFINSEKLSPLEWAQAHSGFSNLALLMGAIKETSVADQPGISYEADGLYASRNIIFADEYHIYYLNGQYLDRDSDIYRDFDSLVESIELK